MRYLLLGTGLLGSALAGQLATRGTPFVALDHAAIDAGGGIAKAASAHVRRGDVVVNAAALTAVDACEDREAEAMEVNGEEPGRLARACLDRGALLVHISTDTVLDVTNVYAKSKALGEQRVREVAGDAALVVRVSTVFGPHSKKVDFVRFVLNTLRKGEEVKAVTDMICSPTYTHDAARAIVAAAEGGAAATAGSDDLDAPDAPAGASRARGVHAFVNEPSMSRYAFALAIQQTWAQPGVVRGVPMSEIPFKAKRPKDTTMRSTLDRWHRPMPLADCLRDYRALWS